MISEGSCDTEDCWKFSFAFTGINYIKIRFCVLYPYCMVLHIFYIYIYAFSRCFYPKRLTLHSSYSFTFYQLLLSLGIEPMILAFLAPCSTIWATGKPIFKEKKSFFRTFCSALCCILWIYPHKESLGNRNIMGKKDKQPKNTQPSANPRCCSKTWPPPLLTIHFVSDRNVFSEKTRSRNGTLLKGKPHIEYTNFPKP